MAGRGPRAAASASAQLVVSSRGSSRAVGSSTAAACRPDDGPWQQAGGPPPAAERARGRRRSGALAALLAAIAAATTLLVLWRTGVLGGGSGDGTYRPLALPPRVRSQAAVPAYTAALHPWLLPAEQAALGLAGANRLDADVIVVGAGVAGLQAAQLLAPHKRVLVLEARVGGGGRQQLGAAACH